MDHKPPLVTIGLPVYNGTRYLPEALESLLAQDFTDFDIVISDNGSTDRTQGICEEYAARDGRIRYSQSADNRGLSWNYRQVVQRSRGQFFKWANHDDVLAPSCLRRCVETLTAAPESVVMVYPRTVFMDEESREISRHGAELDVRGRDPVLRLRDLIRQIGLCNAVFGLFRRSVLDQTRLIGPYRGSDCVFLAHVSLIGEIWQIPEYLFRRRRHAESSLQMNRTWQSLADFFAPGRRAQRFVPPSVQLVVEHLKMIFDAPLRPQQRYHCAAVYILTYLECRWWRLAGPILNRLRALS